MLCIPFLVLSAFCTHSASQFRRGTFQALHLHVCLVATALDRVKLSWPLVFLLYWTASQIEWREMGVGPLRQTEQWEHVIHGLRRTQLVLQRSTGKEFNEKWRKPTMDGKAPKRVGREDLQIPVEPGRSCSCCLTGAMAFGPEMQPLPFHRLAG